MIKSYSLGAVKEVTGSKHVLEFGDNKLIIDCGAFQGKDGDVKNIAAKDAMPTGITEGFLTHAHFDHCGHLPLLIKDNQNVRVKMTSATYDLTEIVLIDSAKIQLQEAQEKKTKPFYTEKDVIKTMKHFDTIEYNKEYKEKDFSYKFYDAGHILGSSMIEFSIPQKFLFWKKDVRILYTGDLGRKKTPITRDPSVNMEAPDYIIMESTYGDRLHSEPSTIYNSLGTVIKKTIRRGGKVIIPSFAIERTQELIFYLKQLMNKNAIPKVPIYVDSPMACQATGVFQFHNECYSDDFKKTITKKSKNPFGLSSLSFIDTVEESLKVAQSIKPCIVISANGMCQAGRIRTHLRYGLGNRNNTILLVGYASEGSLGRQLADGKKVVKIDGEQLEVKAEIEKIDAFSSHADYSEMFSWLLLVDTSRLKKIFLVHGTEEAQEHLKHYLNSKGFKHVEGVELNKKYRL